MSKFIDRSGEAKAALDAALETAFEAVGIQAEGNVKLLVPVDTGLLRNSITHAVSGKPPKLDKYESNETHASTPATIRAGTAGKKLVEKRTGTYNGNAPDDEEKAVYIGTNVKYAPYVEMGTSRNKNPKKFLWHGIQDHIDEYKQIFEAELGNVKI